MKLTEFSAALDAGQVTFNDLMDQVKHGEFTLDEFNAYELARKEAALQEMITAFYAGELFKAQFNDFIDWCNQIHKYQDTLKAAQFEALRAAPSRAANEINSYIALIVKRKRLTIKILDEDPGARQAILGWWNSTIDNNGWRTWPKTKP